MVHTTILLSITLALYSIAAILYLWSMLGKSTTSTRVATIALFHGLAAHSAAMIVKGVVSHHLPFTNLCGSLLFAAWALLVSYLAIERKYRVTALGAFVSLVAVGMVAFAFILPQGISPSLAPALNSRWSGIHIISTLISFTSFILAFAAALGYIVQEHLLKAKRITTLQQHLPPLDTVDRLAYRMVAFGFPMLTIGIITGSIWAQSAWGNWWSWDPKETWSLITWLIYAVYLHVRIVSGWRGKWANRLLITGFACVVITYIGLNFLAQGLHIYRW